MLIANDISISPQVEFSPHNEETFAKLEHDVSVVDIVVTVTIESGKMTLVQAVIQNNGLNAETCAVEFGYLEWDSTFVVVRTRTATDLPPGEQQSISFGFYTFPSNIEYDYFIRVVLQGDLNPDNDVLLQAVNSFTTDRKIVLIEKTTGTWCGYCPGAARCVAELQRVFPGQVAAIDYHVGDEYENAQCRLRAQYYNVSGYPTAKFSGISGIIGGSSAFAWKDLYRDAYKPRFTAAQSKLDSLTFKATAIALPSGIATGNAPATFALTGNHPNPFNPQTTIEYSVGERCTSARLQVYSLLGQLIAEKQLSYITPGVHHTAFLADDFSAGVYVYRIQFETADGSIFSEQKKFTLLK